MNRSLKAFFFLRLQDPLPIKPVGWGFGVAGEPQFTARHRAPGHRLLHKGAGHQSHLVQQGARQRDPLNQGRGPLVLAAEQVKGVAVPAQPDLQNVAGDLVFTAEPHVLQQGQQLLQQVPPHRHNGLAAQGKIFPVKGAHGPAEKGQAGAQGLAAADRSVANDSLLFPLGRAGPPPGQHLSLFWGKHHVLHGLIPPSPPWSLKSGPPAPPRCGPQRPAAVPAAAPGQRILARRPR